MATKQLKFVAKWQNGYQLPQGNSKFIPLATTNEERDLGIILSSNFKFSGQAAFASSKANSILGMLKNAFSSRDIVLWTSLYTTYVRPYLEFAAPAWNPRLKRDKSILEKVQRRATRILPNLREHDQTGCNGFDCS